MPVVIAIIAIIALLGLGFTTVAVILWLNREGRVAVIGRQSAGKTTMLRFLADGHVPRAQAPTTVPDGTFSIKIDNRTFEAFDTAGDRLDQWIRALDASHNVIYLFDASLVSRGDPEVLSALAADTDHIKNYLTTRQVNRHFTVVGTHSDLFAERGRDEEAVRDQPVIQELQLICSTDQDGLIIGSLSNDKSAKTLTKLVLRHAAKGS